MHKHFLIKLAVVLLSCVVFAICLLKFCPATVLPTAVYKFENQKFVGWVGNHMLTMEGEITSVLNTNGEKLVLGNYFNAQVKNGIIFCTTKEDSHCYFALNSSLTGTWLDSALFVNPLDISGAINAMTTTPLYPQLDAKNRLGYANAQDIWMIQPNFTLDYRIPYYHKESFRTGVAFPRSRDGKKMLMLREDGTAQPFCVRNATPSEKGFCDNLLLASHTEERVSMIPSTHAGPQEMVTEYRFVTNDNTYAFERKVFSEALDFSEGLAAVKEDQYWGYINTSGEYQIAPKFLTASSFADGLAAVTRQDGVMEIINSSGNAISSFSGDFSLVGEYHDGLVLVKVGNQYGLADTTGKVVYQAAIATCEWKDKNWRFVSPTNKSGIYIAQTNTAIWSDFPLRVFGSVCIANEDGDDVLYSLTTGKKLFRSNRIDDFSEGLALARGFSGYGYIDKTGEWAINPFFDTTYPLVGPTRHRFQGGLAYVNIEGTDCLIANPLIFAEKDWSPDENIRAKDFGFALNSSDSFSRQDCGILLHQLFAKWDEFSTRQLVIQRNERSPEEYLSELPLQKLGDALITRGEYAHILACVANDLGANTRCFFFSFSDNESSHQYASDIAYIASLGIFNDVGNNEFGADKTMTDDEAALILLRFFESLF